MGLWWEARALPVSCRATTMLLPPPWREEWGFRGCRQHRHLTTTTRGLLQFLCGPRHTPTRQRGTGPAVLLLIQTPIWRQSLEAHPGRTTSASSWLLLKPPPHFFHPSLLAEPSRLSTPGSFLEPRLFLSSLEKAIAFLPSNPPGG